MPSFDWPALMQAGMYDLGLAPAQFWALTPAELALKLGHHKAGASMGRARLDALMRRFPDKGRGGDDGRR